MNVPEPPEEAGVEVPFGEIPPDTLDGLIEMYILREGTDYGENEVPLARKKNQIREQLERGEVQIVFDLTTETCSIVPKRR
jgi:uncharacterized protein